MSKENIFNVVWDERYTKMGVSPQELYMRQHGLCYLRAEVKAEGEVEIYCTDGVDKAKTSLMLNPTLECANCMTKFIKRLIKDGTKLEQP